MQAIKEKANELGSYLERMHYGANEDRFYELLEELFELIDKQK